MSHQRGYSLAELLVSAAILGVLAGFGLPAIGNLTRRVALRTAIARVYSLLENTQEQAFALEANRAVKFIRNPDGSWSYAVYDDGDKDGVLNADILSGVDPLVDGPWELLPAHGLATIGIPREGLPDPDGGPPILPEQAPVQFNRSTLCSFATDGSSTPGSIYIRTIGGDSAVIRSSGDGGRLTILVLAKGSSKWEFPS